MQHQHAEGEVPGGCHSIHRSSRILNTDGIATMSSAVTSLGARSDDSFLDTSNEVAGCFLSLYLEPEKTSLVGRSPSQQRDGKAKEDVDMSASGGQQPTVAHEVSGSIVLGEAVRVVTVLLTQHQFNNVLSPKLPESVLGSVCKSTSYVCK